MAKVFCVYFNETQGNYINPVGDRSVIILDGRKKLNKLKKDAVEENGHRRPLYDAYALYKGSSLLDCKPVTDIIDIKTGKAIRAARKDDF